MTNPVSLTIDQKTIESILQANIQAAVVAQFAKAPDFLDKLVAAALTKKVDHRGQISHYESENKHPMIEVLAGNVIKDAAEAAVEEWVHEHRPDILVAIKRHLSASKVDLVKRFVESADKAMQTSFSVSCAISLTDSR